MNRAAPQPCVRGTLALPPRSERQGPFPSAPLCIAQGAAAKQASFADFLEEIDLAPARRDRLPRRKRCRLPLVWPKARCGKHRQRPVRGSNNCEVDTRTIREDADHKQLVRETSAADSTIARIPKVGLLQPRRQLLR